MNELDVIALSLFNMTISEIIEDDKILSDFIELKEFETTMQNDVDFAEWQ
jgi:hypothetical protein